MAVRRSVAFSEAIYQGQVTVEGVTACRADTPAQAADWVRRGRIPVTVDPKSTICGDPHFEVVALVDGRMTKRPPDLDMVAAPLVIGLGPGFIAGENCHAVIETNRSHYLGRVIWQGAPQANTGIPGIVGDHQKDRVLRAPAAGTLRTHASIGSLVLKGSILAEVAGIPIVAPFNGCVRGLLPDGMEVTDRMKVGDLDPRNDPQFSQTVSEKSLSIGGGVLEALLTRPEIRAKLWT